MLPWPLSAPSPKTSGGSTLFAQAACPVRRAPGQTSACHLCNSHRHGMALAFLQLAARLTHRETGDVYTLASSGLPRVLALEIQARSTHSASRYTGVDSSYGSGKPDVGTGADCQRTVAQARSAGVAAHRAQIHAASLRRQSW